jgi:cobalt-zinc-cadmium efflux system protein
MPNRPPDQQRPPEDDRARRHEHAGDVGHGHEPAGDQRGQGAGERGLTIGLSVIVAFMIAEIVVAIVSSSLALLSDAAHMLTDAAALAMALVAARLAARPPRGVMTYGLGRAEILSAAANGSTLVVLALVLIYGAVLHLVSPPNVQGVPVLVVALVGIAVNLLVTRLLEHGHEHSLNIEGSYQHILTDLLGFIATAVAAAVIITTGFHRADAIASLLIAAIMLLAGYRLLKASMRVIMEAAPAGTDPEVIGRVLAAQPGVTEVHDLHIWEVTSGFPSLSAHVIVAPGHDCHEIRRGMTRLLADAFGLTHSTLQVEHARAEQAPLQIEITARSGD